MGTLDGTQRRNFAAALAVATTVPQRERLAFAIWSESRGFILANDGRNTSNSQGVTPAIAAVLRRSLDLPHDRVGSNGRSTGMLQQISSDVGGAWGDMAGTMDPAESARRFLDRLEITDDPVFVGTLLTPTGTRRVEIQLTVIAADVLRVQQPLADEAQSENYGPANVAIALDIAAQFAPATPEGDLFMATNFEEAKAELAGLIDQKLSASAIDENAGETRRQCGVLLGALPPGDGERTIGEQLLATPMQATAADPGRFTLEQVLRTMNDRIVQIARELADLKVSS